MTSKKADTAALKASREAVIRAARKAGVPMADINRAIGGARLAAKKRPSKWKAGTQPTMDQIMAVFLDALAKHADPVELADLQSDRILRVWAGPRAVAMWVIREVLGVGITLSAIGIFFNRDHSTVVTALTTGAARAVDRDPRLAKASKDAVAFFRKRD